MKEPQDDAGELPDPSRRAFLKDFGLSSLGAVAANGGIIGALQASCANPDQSVQTFGPDATEIELTVNGKKQSLRVEPRWTLAEVLRDHLHLTGTKTGCERGACGACTVWMDGKSVNACLALAVDAIGHDITTIEGLSDGASLHPVQQAFIEHDALQCGFCTPGMVMSCAALLRENKNPSLDDVKEAVSGNLCRCGTYNHVFEAVQSAAKNMK